MSNFETDTPLDPEVQAVVDGIGNDDQATDGFTETEQTENVQSDYVDETPAGDEPGGDDTQVAEVVDASGGVETDDAGEGAEGADDTEPVATEQYQLPEWAAAMEQFMAQRGEQNAQIQANATPAFQPQQTQQNPPAEAPKHPDATQWQQVQQALLQQAQQFPAANANQNPSAPQQPAAPREWISKDQWDEVASDPVKFNAVLNQVFEAAKQEVAQSSERVRQEAAQLAMVHTTPVIVSQVRQEMAVRDAVNEMLRAHPDLGKVKTVVAQVANDIQAKNPGMTFQEVLSKTPGEVYKMFNAMEAKKQGGAQPKRPAFARGTTPSKTTKAPTKSDQNSISSQLAAMMAASGGGLESDF